MIISSMNYLVQRSFVLIRADRKWGIELGDNKPQFFLDFVR